MTTIDNQRNLTIDNQRNFNTPLEDMPQPKYRSIGKRPHLARVIPQKSNEEEDNCPTREDSCDQKRATNISLEFSSVKERINAISVSGALDSKELPPKSNDVGSNSYLERDIKRSFVANAIHIAASFKDEKEKMQSKDVEPGLNNIIEESKVGGEANSTRTAQRVKVV